VLIFFTGGGIEATKATAREVRSEVRTELETRGVPKLCHAADFSREASDIVKPHALTRTVRYTRYSVCNLRRIITPTEANTTLPRTTWSKNN